MKNCNTATIAFDMICPECARLTEEYERLERACSTAIQALTTRGSTGSASEYIALNAAADQARVDSRTALLELQKHWGVHRGVSLVALKASA